MPITPEERAKIESYCHRHIKAGVTLWDVPKTGTIRPKQGNIGVRFTSRDALQSFIIFINKLNREGEQKSQGGRICASVRGGGREHDGVVGSASYSIANLWEGTDVFIQCAWTPVITFPKRPSLSGEKVRTENVICRIPPNIMLRELNQQLHHQGYHCPELVGLLPFMSFAGGLSTNSHSAVAFLSDIVEGIEVLLPNGRIEYFRRGDKDFDLICNRPTLGLLGVITNIDIRVKPGYKQLQRNVEFSTYSKFMRDIERKVQDEHVDLNSYAVIFSPVGLNDTKIVKLTRWSLPEEKKEEKDEKDAPWSDTDRLLEEKVPSSPVQEQKVAPSPTAQIATILARSRPEEFSKVFETHVMNRKLAGDVIANFEDIMGPEDRLTGAENLTEAGIFFDYKSEEMASVLAWIEESFQAKHLRSIYPVNASIFIRFPKRGGRQLVAIDLVSLGQNLPAHEPFIHDLIIFLRGKNLKPGLHYGKSHGICASKICEEDSWSALKTKYREFYAEQKLEQHALNILNTKIQCLELPDIRLQLNKILAALRSRDVMAIIQAYAEFGELLERNYPGKTVENIRSELSKFDEYQKEHKNINSDSLYHPLAAVMREIRRIAKRESKDDTLSDPSLNQLMKGLRVFITLVGMCRSQESKSIPESEKQAVQTGIRCFSALSALSSATEITNDKDPKNPLKAAGRVVWEKTQKALRREMVPIEDLPKLTTYIEGTTAVVRVTDMKSITAHTANTKHVLGIKREWGKFIGSAGLSLLGTALLITSVAVVASVLTMGAATPVSLFVTSLVLAHLSKVAAVATALTACVVATPSVVKSSIYAHRVKRGSIALAGEALGDLADTYYKTQQRNIGRSS